MRRFPLPLSLLPDMLSLLRCSASTSGSISILGPGVASAGLLASVGVLALVGAAGPRSAAAQQPSEEIDRPRSRSAEAEVPRRRLQEGSQRGARFWKGAVLQGAALAHHRKQSAASLVTRAAVGLTGVQSSSTSIADIDEDGNEDLLITGRDANDSPIATLYLGDGQGGFSAADAGLAGVAASATSIADIDGDGNEDLLITGLDANSDLTATLYLGDGQGGFSAADAGLTGTGGGSTSIADVNGDGNQDLLITGVVASAAPTTTLYLGDGQGGFSEANADLTGVGGSLSSSTSVADIDEDGNEDLLITGRDANDSPTATLYLGDGQGGFTKAGASLTGVYDSATSIADVNGDQNKDLLITGNAGMSLNLDPTATLYLGDGQGGFSEANAGLPEVYRGATSIADINRDGNLDLLITGTGSSSYISTLYLGNGQGGFSEANAGLTGVGFGSSTSTADIGGDGDLDLLITGLGSLFGGPSARIYVNRQNQSPPNRAPTFSRTFSYDQPMAPGTRLRRTVEAGDLDGDSISIQPASEASNITVDDVGNGVAEVSFTPSRDQGGRVVNPSVEASDPAEATGSFSTPVEVSSVMAAFSAGLTGVRFGSSTSIADIGGDGNQDLLITGLDANFNPTATLYLGDGQGGFSAADAGLAGVAASATSIADVNGDGNQDLLITGENANDNPTATLYLGDGQGGFSAADAGLAGVSFSATSIADVNGDGNQDLLVAGVDANNDPKATLYLGNGQGGFAEANAGLTGTGGGSTSIADVNGDGNQDLLITGADANFDPTATLYLGDGQGGFSEANVGLAEVRSSSSSVADVDGDQDKDLLFTGIDADSLTAILYLGDGQGSFSAANAGLAGVAAGATSIADVNGNGNQDLLITGAAANNDPTTTLYLGNGQGGFSEANAGLSGAVIGSTSIADIDGDQDLDLLITGFSDVSRSQSAVLYENLFDNPLPVELASLNARTNGQKVHLTWQTASEENNAGFEVQRRVKAGKQERARTWTQVGFVDSKAGGGTTNEALSYRYVDEDLPFAADRLEYRLRQVDLGGTETFTDPVTVDRSAQELRLKKTFPNPVRGQATVQFAVPERREVRLELYDALGRQVQILRQGKAQGRQEMQVDLSGLTSGTYFLQLWAEGKTQTQRLTVVR